MCSGKNSRSSRRISSGGALQRKGERNSRVVPHSQSPPDVSVHSRETCFPCTASTFKPSIDSHHGGTWDSPVGKLPGASVRNPARDKVMRKEADIRKACSDFRDPSGNCGTTLEFLSPFLWRAPPLELRRKRQEFFPEHAGKGSLLSS